MRHSLKFQKDAVVGCSKQTPNNDVRHLYSVLLLQYTIYIILNLQWVVSNARLCVDVLILE